MHSERLANPYSSTHWRARHMSTRERTMGTSSQRHWLRDINGYIPGGRCCGAVDHSARTFHLGYSKSFEETTTSMEGKKVTYRAIEACPEEQTGCKPIMVLLEKQTPRSKRRDPGRGRTDEAVSLTVHPLRNDYPAGKLQAILYLYTPFYHLPQHISHLHRLTLRHNETSKLPAPINASLKSLRQCRYQ